MRPGAVDARELEAILRSPPRELSWEPLFVSCAMDEQVALLKICERAGVATIDHLAGQLQDLARVRHPGSSGSPDRERFVLERSAGGTRPYVGSWVYFHWLRRMIRVLDREDYFEVITSRNQDKITRQEQVRLRETTVGVVGLSVGGEIAVTIAQEHLCGRIKVADFDDLELSNLNRLGSGIDDLGINKAWLVARRIALIDPWLDVEVFDSGLTEENAADFLEDLDLIVDECDSLALKFQLRELARDRGINLLYAADERGMLSIEPYAHAQMPVFHGMVTEPHPPRSAYASDIDFFKDLAAWLGGWEHLSERSRESLPRIGKELAGYPQLAGEPRLAAGQVAHAARRLLLGERLSPFFGYQDLDELQAKAHEPT